jgi:hypothetical protein
VCVLWLTSTSGYAESRVRINDDDGGEVNTGAGKGILSVNGEPQAYNS